MRPLPPGVGAEDRVVFFDGVCNLCNSSVRFIIARDPKLRLKIGTLQSAAGAAAQQLAGLAPGDLDTLVYIDRGRVFTRSGAALRIAWRLRFPWPLFAAFLIVPPFVRDAIYRWVARNRYKWFGKKEVCGLPTPDVQERFL